MKGFISLDEFLNEKEKLNRNHRLLENELDFDIDFLKRAETVKSLNFEAKDFTTRKYKKEIRYLYRKHYFPDFDDKLLSKIKTNSLNDLNSLIDKLKKYEKFNFIYKSDDINGVGPGECILFFLVNDVVLSGGGEGYDIKSDNKTFEVKATPISSDNYAYGIRMGGTFSTEDIAVELWKLAEEIGIKKGSELGVKQIAKIKKEKEKDFNEIEEMFRNITYDNYFKKHVFIFFNHNEGKKQGYIEAIKEIDKDDIFLRRYTSHILRPEIKIK